MMIRLKTKIRVIWPFSIFFPEYVGVTMNELPHRNRNIPMPQKQIIESTKLFVCGMLSSYHCIISAAITKIVLIAKKLR